MRLREIDILRGIAVLLVLLHHHTFYTPFNMAGWFGVDLFFVLSGYLVSGILFKSFKSKGTINPGSFLLRRGFKIYPLFYLVIFFSFLIESLRGEQVGLSNLLSEAFFFQNYSEGIWFHTWSLAVEEHFYILLAFISWALYKAKQLKDARHWVLIGWLFVLSCLFMRIFQTLQLPFSNQTHLFPTHLRIDSLMMGVLLSFLHHFRRKRMISFFQKYSIWLYGFSFLLLSPAFLLPLAHPFIHTVGYSLFAFGFSLLLGLFVTDNQINEKIDRLISGRIANALADIGRYSYGIYLIHIPFLYYGMGLIHKLPISLPSFFEWITYLLGSILLGRGLSKWIEQPFLSLRDRLIPAESKAISGVVRQGN
ncbi:MAG: acyltransferase [Bacteroidota bacterium]